MKYIMAILVVIFTLSYSSTGFAGCNCEDWVIRGGYCVDYVKSKISSFPIPKDVAAIKLLKNEDVNDVKKGDVALFSLNHYWHVAYVENVHPDENGDAATIDVSEMNFGGHPSLEDFMFRWGSNGEREWKRAVCCGVTNAYGQIGTREHIELSTVTQIWSPDSQVMHLFTKLLQTLDIEL